MGMKRAYHLEGREILFPPDELLVLWTHGGHHVIKVHDDVDKSVEQTEEGRVATGSEANTEPDTHRHDAVMNDMQERNVFVLFAQNEEELKKIKKSNQTFSLLIFFNSNYRVEELGELGKVIPPASVDHLNRINRSIKLSRREN